MSVDARLALADRLVRAAGDIARRVLDAPRMSISAKGAGDVVSEADLAIEGMVRREVAQHFPEDALIGEEGGGSGARNGFTWLVDPIDGTVNYTRRLGYFCVSLCLLEDGRPIAAWILDPVQAELFHAGPDRAMQVNGNPVGCSEQSDIREAVFGLGFSPRHAPERVEQIVAAVRRSGAEHRRLGAGALCLAHVAAGRLEGYLEPHMNPWDAVGGLYLAACAGALVGPYLERGGLSDGAPVIALAPAVANTLLAQLPAPFSGTPLSSGNEPRSAGELRRGRKPSPNAETKP